MRGRRIGEARQPGPERRGGGGLDDSDAEIVEEPQDLAMLDVDADHADVCSGTRAVVAVPGPVDMHSASSAFEAASADWRLAWKIWSRRISNGCSADELGAVEAEAGKTSNVVSLAHTRWHREVVRSLEQAREEADVDEDFNEAAPTEEHATAGTRNVADAIAKLEGLVREVATDNHSDEVINAAATERVARCCQELTDSVLEARRTQDLHLECQVAGCNPKPKRKRLRVKTKDVDAGSLAQVISLDRALFAGVVSSPSAGTGHGPSQNRRRGQGFSRRTHCFTALYWNGNSFSEVAERYMCRSKCDAWFFGESHLRGSKLEGAAGRVVAAGFAVTVAPAALSATSAEGTYGGVVGAMRKHIMNSPMPDDTQSGGVYYSNSLDMVARGVMFPGGEIIMAAAYCRHGEVLDKMRQMAIWSMNGAVSFVMAADFNMPPEELAVHPWLKILKAHVVTPRDHGGATCHQGAGSVIDYFVVSDILTGYVEAEIVRDVPSGPHDGIAIKVRRDPRTVLKRIRVGKPEPLFEDPPASFPKPWADCVREAERQVPADPASDYDDVTLNAAREMGTVDGSSRVTREYAVWAKAFEIQALDAQGIDVDSPEGRKKAGRALPPRSKMVAVRAEFRASGKLPDVAAGMTDLATWSSSLAAMMSKMSKVMVSAGAAQINAWRANIVDAAASECPAVVRAVARSRRPADIHAVRAAVLLACRQQSTVEEVATACAMLSRVSRYDNGQRRFATAAEWDRKCREWLVKDIGGAHRWANAPNKPFLVLHAPNVGTSDDSVLDYHSSQWSSVWLSDNPEEVGKAYKAVKELVDSVRGNQELNEVVAKIGPDRLKRVLRAYKKNTGIGTDDVGMRELLGASDECLEAYCDVLRLAVKLVALPLQSLLVLMSVIAKKSPGQSRTVATAATFYRTLMSLIKDDMQGWDRDMCAADPKDTAGPGRRADDEVARRLMMIEVARQNRQHVVALLWDGKQYFDRLPVQGTIDAAVEQGFPRPLLALAMQAHRAPRILTYNKAWGPTVPATGRSILAGCSSSPSLARSHMSKIGITVQARSRHQATSLFRHVDDATQLTVHDTREGAAAAAIDAGARFAETAVASGVTLADKSRVIASSLSLARVVSGKLNDIGIQIKAAAVADDLGVSITAGSRRSVRSQVARIDKSTIRGRRIGYLANKGSRSTMLVKGGVRPMVAYEEAARGTAPAQRDRMRRAMLLGVQHAGYHPCAVTTFEWRLGLGYDPWVSGPVRQVQLFLRLWSSSKPKDKVGIASTWRTAADQAKAGCLRWNDTIGPIYGTVAVLAELRWSSEGVCSWTAADGERYSLKKLQGGEAGRIARHVARDAALVQWKRASKHVFGGGLEEGAPCLKPALMVRKWLAKRDRGDAVRALDAAVCGGLWCTPDGDGSRCACGALDTAPHRYYDCPLLKVSDDEAISSTRWVVDKWRRRPVADSHQCLWLRGILPASMTDLGDAPSESVFVRTSANMADVMRRSRSSYTDGSGGPRWCPYAAKRCGCGWVALDVEQRGLNPDDMCIKDVALAASGVPGAQTVPNAEAWAAAKSIEALPGDVPCSLFPDASYVVKGFNADNKGRMRLSGGQHANSWRVLYQAADARTVALNMVRTPAHCTARQVIDGAVPLIRFIGNTLADGVAAAGAINELSRRGPVPEWVHNNCVLAYSIAKRIAAIESLRWVNGKRTVPMPAPLPEHDAVVQSKCIVDFHAAVKDKGHVLVANGPWIRCTICRRRSRAHQYRRWTKADCLQPLANATPPATLCQKRFVHRADGGGEVCSTSKRQRILKDQREEHKRRASIDGTTRRDAWERAGLAVPFLAWSQLQEGVVTPPVPAHYSHALIACGGYGGCLRCGSVAAGQHCRLLEEVCRRWCPPGSKGPIAKLAKGRLPHPTQAGGVWPDGSLAPTPRLWKVRPPTTQAAAPLPTPPTPAAEREASHDPVPAPPVEWVACDMPRAPAWSKSRQRFRF